MVKDRRITEYLGLQHTVPSDVEDLS